MEIQIKFHAKLSHLLRLAFINNWQISIYGINHLFIIRFTAKLLTLNFHEILLIFSFNSPLLLCIPYFSISVMLTDISIYTLPPELSKKLYK